MKVKKIGMVKSVSKKKGNKDIIINYFKFNIKKQSYIKLK